MKAKQLKEYLTQIPDDADIVIADMIDWDIEYKDIHVYHISNDDDEITDLILSVYLKDKK